MFFFKGMRGCQSPDEPTNSSRDIRMLSQPQLYPADGDDASTPIAEFHRPNYVFNKHKAYLELQPEALEILDTSIGP